MNTAAAMSFGKNNLQLKKANTVTGSPANPSTQTGLNRGGNETYSAQEAQVGSMTLPQLVKMVNTQQFATIAKRLPSAVQDRILALFPGMEGRLSMLMGRRSRRALAVVPVYNK